MPAAGAQSLNLVSLTFHVTQHLSHRRIWGGLLPCFTKDHVASLKLCESIFFPASLFFTE